MKTWVIVIKNFFNHIQPNPYALQIQVRPHLDSFNYSENTEVLKNRLWGYFPTRSSLLQVYHIIECACACAMA